MTHQDKTVNRTGSDKKIEWLDHFRKVCKQHEPEEGFEEYDEYGETVRIARLSCDEVFSFMRDCMRACVEEGSVYVFG